MKLLLQRERQAHPTKNHDASLAHVVVVVGSGSGSDSDSGSDSSRRSRHRVDPSPRPYSLSPETLKPKLMLKLTQEMEACKQVPIAIPGAGSSLTIVLAIVAVIEFLRPHSR